MRDENKITYSDDFKEQSLTKGGQTKRVFSVRFTRKINDVLQNGAFKVTYEKIMFE
jgi:hypothetical protein